MSMRMTDIWKIRRMTGSGPKYILTLKHCKMKSFWSWKLKFWEKAALGWHFWVSLQFWSLAATTSPFSTCSYLNLLNISWYTNKMFRYVTSSPAIWSCLILLGHFRAKYTRSLNSEFLGPTLEKSWDLTRSDLLRFCKVGWLLKLSTVWGGLPAVQNVWRSQTGDHELNPYH